MRYLLALTCAALIASACGGQPPAATAPSLTVARPERPDLILATTTSTQDSGLLDVLVPDFEKRTGYKVKTTAVGTGAALAMGTRGDADVLLVHAPSAEEDYMKGGSGDRRLLVMHNDFILIGPPADPAHIKGMKVGDALRAIATAGAPFISRGDNSGTDILEKSLWKQISVTPQRPWYVEAATGMGMTLTIASEKRAYTISDRATYLARRSEIALDLIVDKDPPLINIYHVITVNPTKFPRVNRAGAEAFASYLVSKEAQDLIGRFGVDKFGQQLFFPDAGKKEEDLAR